MPLLSSSFLNRRKASPIGSRSWTRIRKGIRSSSDLDLPSRYRQGYHAISVPKKPNRGSPAPGVTGGVGSINSISGRARRRTITRNSTPQTGRQGEAFSPTRKKTNHRVTEDTEKTAETFSRDAKR